MKWRVLGIIMTIGILTMLFVASVPVKAATLTLSSSPTEADLGEQLTYALTITNSGSDSVYVEEVYVHFDWEAANLAYTISDGAEIILSGESFTYEMTILIPGSGITTNVQHNIETTVIVADSDGAGGWYSTETKTYTRTILINEESDSSPGFELPVIIIATIIGVGMFAVMKRRK